MTQRDELAALIEDLDVCHDEDASDITDAIIAAGWQPPPDPPRCEALVTLNGENYRCGLWATHVESGPKRHCTNILRADGSTWTGEGEMRW